MHHRVLYTVFTVLFVLINLPSHSFESIERKGAILQGTIRLEPVNEADDVNKIRPGSSVKLLLRVDNEGAEPNLPGHVMIRYAFSKPLHNRPNSSIFETEKVNLPSIEPGKSIDIAFTKKHPWPSICDFIRYDWSMREYQAIVEIDEKDNTIGTLAMTFSAYYYPGISEEYSVEVPARP